ncbi:MAG: gluconokinase [Anaerolineales bacterium]
MENANKQGHSPHTQSSSDGLSDQILDSSLGIILMGVSGCGKTSVGINLSKKLDWPFFDGDDFHHEENVAKMSAGQPLTDQDRLPWLITLNDLLKDHLQKGTSMILACSALKEEYRQILTSGISNVVFVHLRGDFDLIHARMQARRKHYMKAEMLRSQFASLEPPKNGITVEVDQSLEEITAKILKELNELSLPFDVPGY